MQIKNTYTKQHYTLQEHTYSETPLKCIRVGAHKGGKDVGKTMKWERGLAQPKDDSGRQPWEEGGFHSLLYVLRSTNKF